MNHQDKQLDALLRDLPKGIKPQNDMWRGIEQRMDVGIKDNTDSKKYNWQMFAAASLLLFSVALSWQWLFAPDAQNLQANSVMLQLIDQLQQQHQKQVQAYDITVEKVEWRSQTDLKPINNGLKEVREAAAQVIKQLKSTPNDKQLWELWLWVQQKELELLNQKQSIHQLETIHTI
ncbi:MAG: hypothetical protein ACPGUD_04450 [Parashewanella sp.]